MTSHEVPVFGCPCCGLQQPPAVDKSTGVKARVCEKCTHHHGDQDSARLRRAEAHEHMLRERMDACRASEAKARAAGLQADKRADEYYERMKDAFRSRGRLAARIVEAAESPGRSISQLAADPDVKKWALRAEADDWSDDADF